MRPPGVIFDANSFINASAAVKHVYAIIVPVTITSTRAIIIEGLDSSGFSDTKEAEILYCS